MSDQPPLSVADLDLATRDIMHWQRFAVHLEGLVFADLEAIVIENRSVDEQRLALFNKWLRKCATPTWSKLVLALEKADENRLAQTIRHEKLINVNVDVDEETVEKLQRLNETFMNLATELKIKLQALVESGMVNLSNLEMFVQEDRAYSFKELHDVADISSFFRIILPHYHFLDCHLPMVIARRFLNPSEVLEGLYRHQRNISLLKQNVKIKELKGVLESFVEKSTKETPITVKAHNAWNSSELYTVEVLLRTLFRLDEEKFFKLFRVVPGSVIIVFLAPQCITVSNKCDKEFMRLLGIVYIQVGDTYILRDEEDDDDDDYSFEMALIEAVESSHHDAVKFLLEHAHVDINTQVKHFYHDTGTTPLMIACCIDDISIIRLLLDYNADPNIQTKSGSTALMYAARLGSEEVDLLVKHNADVNTSNKTNGVTALMCACAIGNVETATALLKHGANPNMKRDKGKTALYIASKDGNLEIVMQLLMANADAGVLDNDHVSPLFIASQNGHSEVVDEILQANASPDTPAGDGATPLYIASQQGHVKVVNRLLRANANPNTPIDDGSTPLCVACQNDRLEVVDYLLQSDAIPDVPNDQGETPLLIASRHGYSDIVARLLQEGCNPDAVNNDGESSLFVACENGYTEIVRQLLQANANVDTQTVDGVTPFVIGGYHGHNVIVGMLENYLQATSSSFSYLDLY